MQKINKNILLFSIILIFLLSLSSVSAEDLNKKNICSSNEDVKSIENIQIDSSNGDTIENNDVDTTLCSTTSSKNDTIVKENKNKVKDSKKTLSLPDLNDCDEEYIHHIDSDNLDSYFNNGILNDGFENSILVFNGEFNDKGIIRIKSPNVQIVGNNTLFKNTVFYLDAANILLSDLNFVLDQEFYDTDYAGILVSNNNNTIYNCTMNYTVPTDCSGICVYCEGPYYKKLEGFNLINNTFNFIGNNQIEGEDYCVFVDHVDNAIVYGNIINAVLPLRDVDWTEEIYGGARNMDKVAAFISDNCENLTLTNNQITTKVNSRNGNRPTLDTVLIYDSNNTIIENNFIYSEDFCTELEEDNYLQGIDLYSSDNVTIINNQVHIRTTGGIEEHGTAYPMQITGPATNIKIAYNNISSVNNGPNIGIYAHNFYGNTTLQIISNFINITGFASKHGWALVSGIEVQDSNDIILNNTIIVNNIGEYNEGDNIYGISYSQSTADEHTYNIQYNNVMTNGKYSVFLMKDGYDVVNSIVANNILNSGNTGDDAVIIGKGDNNHVYNNTDGVTGNSMNYDDLPDWLKNHKTVTPPIPQLIIPKHTSENSNGSGLTDDEGNGIMPWNKTGTDNGLNSNNANNDTHYPDKKQKTSSNGTRQDSEYVHGSTKNIALKIGGTSPQVQSSASPGDVGSSAANSKTYEVKEKAKKMIKSNNYLPAMIISALAILLIFVGYRRREIEE